jgi:hypothetical protein
LTGTQKQKAPRIGAAPHRKEQSTMTRNLKIMGLALVAMLALGASAASSASAQHQFTSDEADPVYLTAESSNAVFSTKTATIGVECETNEAVGSAESPTEEVTVTPTYEGCTAGFLGEAPVDMTGCSYVLFSETTEHLGTDGETVETHAPVTIECPDEARIDVEISACPITIDDQEDGKLHGVTYHNDEGTGGSKDDVTVTVTVDKIHYEGDWTEENNFLCETLGGLNRSASDGTYTGSFTVTGFADQSHTEPVNIHVK